MAITDLTVKQSGIALPDPTQTAGANWTASCVITGNLVAALCEVYKARAVASKTDAQHMGRIQRTGAWLSVIFSTVNGTELGAQYLRDYLFLIYDINPPDLPDHCDGCGAVFSIFQALDCNKGSLITARHNEICDGVYDLAVKAFTPPHMCDYPKKITGRSVRGGKAKPKVKGPPP